MTEQNRKSDSGDEIVKAKPAETNLATDELVADKRDAKEQLFEELSQRADAVDRVLMEKGDPEYDLTSG